MRARPLGLPLLLGSLWCSPVAGQVVGTAPVQPAPVAPEPAEPGSVEPAPVEPAPVEPAPTEGAPAEPGPVEATPAQAAAAAPPAEVPRVVPPSRGKVPGRAQPDLVETPHGDKPSRFFAHVALGGGYFHAGSGAQDDTRTFSGGTFSGQLALGGRIGGKTLVGGAYLHDQVLGLSSSDEVLDGDEPTLQGVAFSLWAIGFFADVPLQVDPGLHFQMLFGIGTLAVARNDGSDIDDPNGLLVNFGVGYDFRVGRHLALGALLRASYSSQDVEENTGTNVLAFVPALLLTATTR